MSTPPARPLIGITGRRRPAGLVRGMRASVADSILDLHFSNYAHHVHLAGGLPVQLSPEADVFPLVDRLDGIVLSGGADVDPRAYGGAPATADEDAALEPERDRFELALVAAAWSSGKPLLGICRGAQVLAVARGGSLRSDLSEATGARHPGERFPVDVRVHGVSCSPDSRLREIYGPRIDVNTLHHHAVADPGDGLAATAVADDGVIEGIEARDHDVLAVQWHPERLEAPDPCFAWIVERAGARTAAGGEALR